MLISIVKLLLLLLTISSTNYLPYCPIQFTGCNTKIGVQANVSVTPDMISSWEESSERKINRYSALKSSPDKLASLKYLIVYLS